MAKNNKPLTIAVERELLDTPEVQALIDKGHNVAALSVEADIILSRRAWRMPLFLVKHVDTVVKAARAVKYPKKGSAPDELPLGETDVDSERNGD